MNQTTPFKAKTPVLSLAMIMSFRMLGLFMILPVFSIYAEKLPHATPMLVGIALGAYGLTQALLQIPFGLMSDRFGRKPIIAVGLLLFVFGSIVCAMSHTIYGMILGRLLQGGGAVGSTILAFVADLTPDENRSKAMAKIGLTIGSSFMIAMILGPMINASFHLSGIFWFTAILAILGLVLLYATVPTPPKLFVDGNVETIPGQIKKVLKNGELLRLDFGILAAHAIMTITFIAIPIIMHKQLQLSGHEQTFMYLVILFVAFLMMLPFMIIAEKKRKIKAVFVGAVAVITFSELLLGFVKSHTYTIALLLLLFFTAFTLLEATLPSLVSKISSIKSKGTAMGVYSSSQFFGIFVGGVSGGFCYGHFGVSSLFILSAIIGFIWLVIAITMPNPSFLSTMIFELPKDREVKALEHLLTSTKGLHEVVIVAKEKLVYVKADTKIIKKEAVQQLVTQQA